MRLPALLLVLWTIAAPAVAQIARPETVRDTLELMRNAYLTLDGVETAEIDFSDQSISVGGPSGIEFLSYPDNLHRQLQAAESDAERQQIFDGFLAGLVESFAAADADVPKDVATILPVIRHEDFPQGVEDDLAPLSDPFVGDLRIFYVFNNPTTLSYVVPGDATELGLDASELFALASGNLARAGWHPEIAGDGISYLVFDGTYEASFLLNSEIWNDLDEELGQIVMIPLARDLVLFTDADRDGAEASLQSLAADLWEEVAYPLSNLTYEWRDGAWQVRR